MAAENAKLMQECSLEHLRIRVFENTQTRVFLCSLRNKTKKQMKKASRIE